jgi:uncharacterized protein YegP (UPF0339 family)
LRAIDAARFLARREKNYEILRSDTGFVYFVLKDARGEIFGRSQNYVAIESSRQGMTLAKTNAHGARLEDLTDKQ